MKKVMLNIIVIVLFSIAVSLIAVWSKKLDDEKVNNCVDRGCVVVRNWRGWYRKCVCEVECGR